MNKRNCSILYILIISLILLNTIGSPLQSYAATSAAKDSLRLIIYQTKIDLDNDRIPEKLVFDTEKEGYGQGPGDYSRLLIYKTINKKEVLIFDSVKAGVTDFCGVDYEIVDNNKDGIPEIYLVEWGFASDPCRLAIIEAVHGKFMVTFFDYLDDYDYKDFDHDGHLELYGVVKLGGQVRFNAPIWAAFSKKNNKYVPSYENTQILIKWLLDEALEEFKQKQGDANIYLLIGLYVSNGNKTELKNFVKNNQLALKQHLAPEELANPDLLINSLESIYFEKELWLNALKVENMQHARANIKSEIGFKYYKEHNDNMAIDYYEDALRIYPTAEIYYRYGNSLSNIPRLQDAVEAYQNALKLHYDKPHLVYYNIACAYSKMRNSKSAFSNLEIAINMGYSNFDYILKDPDLVFLRSLPEWSEWWVKHKR